MREDGAVPTELSAATDADSLARTSTERAALERLREVVGDRGGAMERHGLRCFLIAERLAGLRGAAIDREALFVAALLHDIGLYEEASSGGVYVSDGMEFAAAFLAGQGGWSTERARVCLDAIERHHELRPQWAAGVEVEVLRRADLADLSRGAIAHGAGRRWLSELWAAVPREGTYKEIGRMVLKAARERPATLPRIFLRGR